MSTGTLKDTLYEDNLKLVNESYEHFKKLVKCCINLNLEYQYIDTFVLLKETNPKLLEKYCMRYSITESATDIAIIKDRIRNIEFKK